MDFSPWDHKKSDTSEQLTPDDQIWRHRAFKMCSCFLNIGGKPDESRELLGVASHPKDIFVSWPPDVFWASSSSHSI